MGAAKGGGGTPQQQSPGGGKGGGGTPQMQPGGMQTDPSKMQALAKMQQQRYANGRDMNFGYQGRPGFQRSATQSIPYGFATPPPAATPAAATDAAAATTTPNAGAAAAPPANEQQMLDQQRLRQNADALRQGGVGGLASYAGRGIGKNGGKGGGGTPQQQGGKYGGGQPQGQSNPMQALQGNQQAMQGLASLLGGYRGFAEGGPVTAAPVTSWTPTGANISPGTPSGPVVWNPNLFGGGATPANTGGLPTGIGTLAPITAPTTAPVGVVKYVAPPPPVKPADPVKKEVKNKEPLRWAEGGSRGERGSYGGFGDGTGIGGSYGAGRGLGRSGLW